MAVVGGLGLLCCGGVFLGGRSIFVSTLAVDKEGKAFATQAVQSVAKKWDPEEMRRQGSALYQREPREDTVKAFALWKERLGSLKSLGEFTTTNINSHTDAATGSRTTLQINAPATFEKAEGTVSLTVAKVGDKWGIDSLAVKSPALTEKLGTDLKGSVGDEDSPGENDEG